MALSYNSLQWACQCHQHHHVLVQTAKKEMRNVKSVMMAWRIDSHRFSLNRNSYLSIEWVRFHGQFGSMSPSFVSPIRYWSMTFCCWLRQPWAIAASRLSCAPEHSHKQCGSTPHTLCKNIHIILLHFEVCP